MSYSNIQSALDTKLSTMTGLPAVQYENTRNIAKTGTSFIRATFLPATPRTLTVGVSGKEELSGLYQIDCFAAQDVGVTDANTLADAIKAFFPKGLTLTSGGTNVHVVRTYRQPGGRNEMFYQIPVIVQWSAVL